MQIDSDELVVTRRLYRSGESEYYLNNDRARLKDIIEIFLDSGLEKKHSASSHKVELTKF